MSAGSLAGDLVVERAWLEDPGGQLSWEEVRQQPMKPLAGVVSAGYSQAPIWMRLRIDPGKADNSQAQPLYLRVRPMYLDEIVLFDPLQSPARRPAVGDRYPITAQSEPATTFVVPLPAGHGPRDIWLRIQSTSTRLAYADVFTATELKRQDSYINHLGALYLGLIAVFFLLGLIQVLMRPEALIVSYLCYQGSWLLLGACFLGYPYLYLSQGWPEGLVDRVTNVLIILATGWVLVFSYFVLDELGPARWRRRAMALLMGLFPVLLLAVLTGHERSALQVNMVLILLVPVSMLVMAMLSKPVAEPGLSRPARNLPKVLVVGYFMLTATFTLLTALPGLGLVQGAELSLYVVFFYSLAAGMLMLLMLQYRTWLTLRQQSELRAVANQAKLRADQEQAHREEQQRLLAMLGHELKTPLATMRMLLADQKMPEKLGQQVDASVTEMTRVLDLALQSGQMEAGRIRLDLQQTVVQNLIETVRAELPDGQRVVMAAGSGADARVVMADRQLLKVVLRNLLDNALKYSPAQSTVSLSLTPDDGQGCWTLEISNLAGRAGLPDPQRVFEKYYRSPRAGHRSGTGLGLYLVQGLVQALGGHLRYAPTPDQARFILRLPIEAHAQVSP